MSQRGVSSVEPDSVCELCGKVAETRPYGPRGERVCFQCGMLNKGATERAFSAKVLGEEIQ